MVSNLSIIPLTAGAWRLAWSGATQFRIYRNGVLIATTTLNRFDVTIGSGEFPVFEVLDEDDGDPTTIYPARMQIGWYVDPTVQTYQVQQYVSGWTTLQTIANDGTTVYRLWTSDILADQTTHQFRVLPVGTQGNEGTPIELSGVMARIPDPPQVSFEYQPARNPWTLVQGIDSGQDASGSCAAGVAELTPGNLCVVVATVEAAPGVNAVGVEANVPEDFELLASLQSGGLQIHIWAVVVANPGINEINVYTDDVNSNFEIWVGEYSGNGPDPFHDSATGSGSGASPVTGTVEVPEPGMLLIGAITFGEPASVTAGSGFTELVESDTPPLQVQHKLSASADQTSSWTGSVVGYMALVASFKAGLAGTGVIVVDEA